MSRRSFQPSEAVLENRELFRKIRPCLTSYGEKESLKTITVTLHVTFMLELNTDGDNNHEMC